MQITIPNIKRKIISYYIYVYIYIYIYVYLFIEFYYRFVAFIARVIIHGGGVNNQDRTNPDFFHN